MAGGRPIGSINTQRPFADALRLELAAGGDQRHLRAIARNLIELAKNGEPGALPAIREIADRCDGRPRQEAEVTLRAAVARELTDDDLAAIAAGAPDPEIEADPKPDPSKLN